MEYIRTKENQEKHDVAVGSWAKRVIAAGWNSVWSDLPGNDKPPTIGIFIPDIYATHNEQKYIIEIETIDSAKTPHAIRQKIAFQTWANASPSRKFEVKVV